MGGPPAFCLVCVPPCVCVCVCLVLGAGVRGKGAKVHVVAGSSCYRLRRVRINYLFKFLLNLLYVGSAAIVSGSAQGLAWCPAYDKG